MGHLQDNAEITFHRRDSWFQPEIHVRWHLGCESIDRNYAMSQPAMRALVQAAQSSQLGIWDVAVQLHLPSLVQELNQNDKVYLLNTYRALFQDLAELASP